MPRRWPEIRSAEPVGGVTRSALLGSLRLLRRWVLGPYRRNARQMIAGEPESRLNGRAATIARPSAGFWTANGWDAPMLGRLTDEPHPFTEATLLIDHWTRNVPGPVSVYPAD
jgi:hypothetical protein